MTVKEKKLINIMLFIVLLGLIFKGAPFAYSIYQQGRSDVVNFKDKRERLIRLINRKDFWQSEYNKSLEQEADLNKELFIAKSNELVAAKVQSVIKTLAKESGVRIDSMHLAEFRQSGKWLLVSLSLSINSKSNNLINLLNKIKSNNKTLLIKGVSFRHYSDSLIGTITVVGFSRSMVPNSVVKVAR
jgi:hypothetical protein